MISPTPPRDRGGRSGRGSAREFGDTAEVRSIETDSTFDEAAVDHLTYSLVRESGHWLIDDVTDDDAN